MPNFRPPADREVVEISLTGRLVGWVGFDMEIMFNPVSVIVAVETGVVAGLILTVTYSQ